MTPTRAYIFIPNDRGHPDAGRLAKAFTAIAATVPPEQARLLVARAFQAGDWTVPFDALPQVQPDVLAQTADKLLSSANRLRAAQTSRIDGLKDNLTIVTGYSQ